MGRGKQNIHCRIVVRVKASGQPWGSLKACPVRFYSGQALSEVEWSGALGMADTISVVRMDIAGAQVEFMGETVWTTVIFSDRPCRSAKSSCCQGVQRTCASKSSCPAWHTKKKTGGSIIGPAGLYIFSLVRPKQVVKRLWAALCDPAYRVLRRLSQPTRPAPRLPSSTAPGAGIAETITN